jgi:CheY-like chemotaxis protein/anti-sigma regulatory factor (Ser/Thr protein kinase)
VSGLRTLSRPEAPEARPVDVARAVDAAVGVAAGSFAGRVRFTRSGEPVPPVRGDEARLGQVLLNLLTNAAQAIPKQRRDGHVEVTTRRTSTGRVAIEVRDDGTGIAPEHLSHVFDPFFTTKPRESGTGLGLSICRRIVEALGGAITVESVPGEGSTFRVVLPTFAADTRAAPTPRAREHPRPRLLIVDDEPHLVVALTALLEADYDVRTATSAADALAGVLAGARYDAILCDLMMNDVGGPEFHTALTELSPEQSARIVFMTGGAFTPAARAFLERVPNPCLSKPVDLASLERMLRERLGA